MVKFTLQDADYRVVSAPGVGFAAPPEAVRRVLKSALLVTVEDAPERTRRWIGCERADAALVHVWLIQMARLSTERGFDDHADTFARVANVLEAAIAVSPE